MHRSHHHRVALEQRGCSTHVEISVMGGFGVAVDGVSSPAAGWARRSASALVKILALAPRHRLHRETVMDLLWPDEAPELSAPRLHKAAHFARRAAGRDDAVVLRDEAVSLFPGAEIIVDAVQFERLARVAVGQNDPDAARDALGWYAGDLLPDDRYANWAVDRRELLHLRRLDVLRVAAEWRELTELNPLDEEAHMRVMRQHIDAGAGAAALRQYEHLARVLERDLGIAPGRAVREASVDARDLARTHVAGSGALVGTLLTELVDLVNRQTALLAELAAAGVVAASVVAAVTAGAAAESVCA